jgi:hypothetical protein
MAPAWPSGMMAGWMSRRSAGPSPGSGSDAAGGSPGAATSGASASPAASPGGPAAATPRQSRSPLAWIKHGAAPGGEAGSGGGDGSPARDAGAGR